MSTNYYYYSGNITLVIVYLSGGLVYKFINISIAKYT